MVNIINTSYDKTIKTTTKDEEDLVVTLFTVFIGSAYGARTRHLHLERVAS